MADSVNIEFQAIFVAFAHFDPVHLLNDFHQLLSLLTEHLYAGCAIIVQNEISLALDQGLGDTFELPEVPDMSSYFLLPVPVVCLWSFLVTVYYLAVSHDNAFLLLEEQEALLRCHSTR